MSTEIEARLDRLEKLTFKTVVTLFIEARKRVEALPPVPGEPERMVDKARVVRILQEVIDESVKFV